MAGPANLCRLRKDKAIGADIHKGFADTFNWVVRSMMNLQGGTACNVNWVAPDMPVIDVNTYVTGDRTNELSGGGAVTLSGTDDSASTGNEFKFVSFENSNISVSIGEDNTISVGCYYI